MTLKHTPLSEGPWECRARKDSLVNIYVAGTQFEVALCAKPADGKLIAALPDLLSALQSIATNSCCTSCQEAALIARAAISKATGE